MHKHFVLLFTLVLCASCTSCSNSGGIANSQTGVFGHWEGSIGLPSGPLRIFLHVERDSAGKLAGSIDSPDQLAFQIPITGIDTVKDSIDLNVFSLMARYQGKLLPSGDEIAGQWAQGESVHQLNFKRNDDVAFTRPQEPKKPYPYIEEEFAITLRDKGKLAGTLTLPNGNGPFPLVILLSGSGPQDRNETIAAHKPFLVISDHLTREGIAVLRYDDRGVGGSKAVANVSAADVAQDVIEIIRSLRSHAKIDQKRIGLIGHSEGGFVSGIAATQDTSVSFAVLLASPALPGDSILKLQFDKIAGNTLPPIMRTLQHRSLNLVKSITDSATLRREIESLYKASYDSAGPQVRERYKTKEAFASASASMLMSKPMQFLIRYDPRADLSKLTIPVLALYGANDLQVPPEQNLPAMKLALARKANSRVDVLPTLNHLFQTSKTGELKEYGTIKETFSHAALKLVSDWIKALPK